MKETVKIKQWQLIRYSSKKEVVDLSEQAFLSIGKRAFWRRRRLEKLVLPAGVSAIKTEAFYGCKRLKSVVLSDDCNVGIAASAFRNCARLSEITHFESVTSIGKNAFTGCQRLGELALGEDLKSIGETAFRGCTSLETVRLPQSVQTLGKGAFRDCTELTTVALDASMLAPELFRGCISLYEFELSPLVSEIPRGCFHGCSALERVVIPSTVKRLKGGSFADCSRLAEVEMELGVETVGSFAFVNANRLARVVLPHSVKRLGFGAFGLGRSRGEKIEITVDNEYMLKRIRRQLFLCGSAGRASVTFEGKTIEERRRERRRTTLEQTPTHLIDTEEKD